MLSTIKKSYFKFYMIKNIARCCYYCAKVKKILNFADYKRSLYLKFKKQVSKLIHKDHHTDIKLSPSIMQ